MPAPPPRSFDLGLPPFSLEAGPALPRLHLTGWWWGPPEDLPALEARARPAPSVEAPTPRAPPSPPAPDPDAPRFAADVPTVLLLHALTGDARAGGPGGWWSPVIGPGRPLDPQRVRLLCFNNLGSGYGSFGGSAPDWPWVDAPPVGAGALGKLRVPAPVTTWDQARAVLRALDRLGVETVRVAVGGSLGGMLVLALGALAPERFLQLIPVAASTAASPWIIGLNHVARQVILLDPGWPDRPARGLALARQLAQMSYRAEPGLQERQNRLQREGSSVAAGPWSARHPYAVETYLEHQGTKLVARLDAASYLTQLAAMDHHDLERPPPPPDPEDRWRLEPDRWTGSRRLQGRIDAVGIDSDLLYFPDHMRDLAEAAPDRLYRGFYREISSPHGHDAFLIEWNQLDALLRAAGAPFETLP